MSNPRLNAVNAAGGANASATDFTIDQVVKANSAARRNQKQIVIPRYIPVDANSPPKFLVYCDEQDGRLDPYRGDPIKSPKLVEYLKGAMALDGKNPRAILAYAAKSLDSDDAEVSAEAFHEFARASDADVLVVAKGLDAKRMRKAFDDPNTPSERLNLLAYVLASCGTSQDAAHLRQLLQTPGDRYRGALSGMYAGFIMLNPDEGWRTVLSALADSKRPYHERNAALAALRFHHNTNPSAYRPQVLSGIKSLLPQEDIADLPIEDLRRWQLWDLTTDVLNLFGRKTHDAPLMRSSIIRYALSCPNLEAKAFIAKVRLTHGELVRDQEESLEYERGAKP
jgi:hypothetical protein